MPTSTLYAFRGIVVDRMTDRSAVPERRATHDAADAERLRVALEEERRLLSRIARIAALLTSERDPDRLMQRLTDEATKVVGASFGSFFYNVTRADGESYMLYTLSGAPREAFEKFGMPRNTAVFGPTFKGEGVVRSDDITKDPRYGKNAPHHGMPKGHLPVVSYLAVPVRLDDEVIGGLFFGHERPAVFGEREERAVVALAAIAAAALDNAKVFKSLDALNVRLRLVSEATREGIWFWDIASNHVEWNDALLQKIGIDRASWGGKFDDWFARVHPDDQPRMAEALKGHLERREPYRIDLFRLRHASGEWRWFTTAGQAEWDAEGRAIRMAGSVRDVTDRKLAEDALRASQLRYAQILDSVGDMIFCKNDALEVVYANAATLRHYGLVDGKLAAMADDADDRKVFEEGVVVERHEQPSVSASGELRFLHTVKTPLRDESGKVVELVGVSRDITDRKRAIGGQRKLAEASAILGSSIEYEATLANVARAMVPGLADWCAVDVLENGVIRRIAVAHPDATKVALAYELEERYPSDPNATTGVPNVLRTGKTEWVGDIPDELLVAAARDDEHLRIARALGLSSYIIVPMIAHDRVLGAISLVTEGKRRFDESDVVIAEELAHRVSTAIENALLYREVRELNATLEKRVEERTAALVEANKELESFSYTVSHDLRAPIRHIGGFVDLLRANAGGSLDTKATHYLDTIKNAAIQMGALIDGLLAFSRLGRAAITKRPVDLDAVVRAVVRDLEPETRGRTIVWTLGDLPVVDGDPTMLRLALTNLLSNAVKYTRKRPDARIDVGSERRGEQDVVFVKDNGAGFDMAYVDKLFGVFQRLHAESDFEGTGIGLATTRRIVNRHGGRIWAEGELGKGATFFFTLPAAESSS